MAAVVTTVGVLAVPVLLSPPAQAVSGGGPVDPAPPWAAYISIGQPGKVVLGKTDGVCTGTIVSAHWILTANHCIRDPKGNLLPKSDFHVIVGRATITDTSEGPEFPVEAIDYYTPYDTTWITGDVALLEIAGPLPAAARPLPLAPSGMPAQTGAPVTGYGYGYALETYNSKGDPVKKERSVVLLQTRQRNYTEFAGCGSAVPAADELLAACAGKSAAATSEFASGDSGGPWVTNTVHPFIVGVHTGSWDFDAKTLLYDRVRAARVADQPIHNWIAAKAGIPQGVVGDIYVEQGTNEAWLFESDHFLHPIPANGTDDVYQCLINNGHKALTEGAFSIAQYPENAASPATCTPGTHWEAMPLPLPSDQSTGYPNPTVSNVACTSGSSAACAAVGEYSNDSGDGLAHAYIDSGSGPDWHAAIAPLPGNATDDNNGALTAVACGTACAAIGQYRPPSGSAALIEAGSGGSWTPVQAPVPGSAYAGSLSVVACGTSCVAAGKEEGADGKPVWEGLLEAGSGASWSASVAPLPADALAPNGGVNFTGAACASSTCLVYGTYEDKNQVIQGLVETEAGGKWTVAKLPYPASTGAGQSFAPTAAACQSATICTIVGDYNSADGAGWTAMVTGSGTHWEAVALPIAYVDVTLNSMSCPTASSCTATGAYQIGNVARILAVTGSGAKWTERFAPLPPHGGPSEGGVAFPEVSGTVSCTSATACVTVGGYYADSLTSWPYLSAEQGGSWGTVTGPVPSPHTSDPNAGLNSVACPSANNCVAVGTYAIPVPPGQFLLSYWELPYVAVEVRN